MDYRFRRENWKVQEQREGHRQSGLVDLVSHHQRHVRVKPKHVLLNHVWM